MDGDEKTLNRISAVTRLVTGFASPYGVELLATVHWTATREAPKELITDPVALTKLIRRWNERKGRLFTEAHIRKAADRLKELDWVTAEHRQQGQRMMRAGTPQRAATSATGLTLDAGALIALEAGSRRMALRVEQAMATGAELAVPAGVVAEAWRGGARQARTAKLLQLKVTSVVALDARLALRVGATCAATGSTDVVDASVALCARDRGHSVVTSDPGDIAKIDPSLTLIRPM